MHEISTWNNTIPSNLLDKVTVLILYHCSNFMIVAEPSSVVSADLRLARQYDHTAKEEEVRLKRRPKIFFTREESEHLLELRSKAAEIYAMAGDDRDAAYNFSRAAGHASMLHDMDRSLRYRREAIRCFDECGLREEAIPDLAFYAERLIREAVKTPPSEALLKEGAEILTEARKRLHSSRRGQCEKVYYSIENSSRMLKQNGIEISI